MNIADGVGYTRSEIFVLVARVSFIAAFGFFSMKWIMNQLDPTNNAKKKARKKVINLIFSKIKSYITFVLHAHLKSNLIFRIFFIKRYFTCFIGTRTVTKTG